MKDVLSPPKCGWLAAALFGSLVIGSCTDNVAPIPRAAPSPPERNAGAGNAQTLSYPLTPNPVDGSAYVATPDSIRFKHLSWVSAVASGSVRRVATYPWTEVPSDTTFPVSQGYAYVDRGNGSRVFFGTTPVDMELIYYGGYLAPAGVGFLGHGAGTIDMWNYAPPGYPHVDCGPSKPIHCESYTGSITITVTPYHSDMVLVADSSLYHPGSIAWFNLTLNPTTVNGHGIPYDADSSWWVPDDAGSGGDPSEQAMSGPGLAALSNPSAGHRVVVGSGTLSISAWVNGAWQSKSVHINSPSLKLVPEPGRVHPGDSVTFTPSWSDGVTVSSGNISGWTWTPDSPPGHATNCAALVPCRAKIQEPGTMKVSVTRNGVTRTATAHVTVYTTFRLDADKATAHYGETVTFTPKYDDQPGPAARWRWVPTDTSTHDTVACDPGVTNCAKQMVGSGTMWAYVSLTSGSGDSASKAVTVQSVFELRAAPSLVAPGGVVTFRPYLNGQPTQAIGWKWVPDATAPWDTVAGCAGPASECHRATFESGTMWAYGSGSMAGSADVVVSSGCAGGMMSQRKGGRVGAAPTTSRVARPRVATQSASTTPRAPAGRPVRTVDCSDTLATNSDAGTDSLPPFALHVIVDGNGLSATPPAGDWMYPQGTVIPYKFAPLAGFESPVVAIDSMLDTIPKGDITLNGSRTLEVANDSMWAHRMGMDTLRARLRSILTATDKPAAFAAVLKWSLDTATSTTLEQDVALAEYLEFDPVADAASLGNADDALANYVFEIRDSTSGHSIQILSPSVYAPEAFPNRARLRRSPPTSPSRDVLPSDSVEIVYVNGIGNFAGDAFNSWGVLNSLVARAHALSRAGVAYYWNRNIRTTLNGFSNGPSGDGCAGFARRDATFRQKLVAAWRYSICTHVNNSLTLFVTDLKYSADLYATTQRGAIQVGPRSPDVTAFADAMSMYHAASVHTVAVMHSQGNMVFANALPQISTVDVGGRTMCTAGLSLAAPIDSIGFGHALDSLHLRGMTINGDVLLFIGLPNSFPRFESDTSLHAEDLERIASTSPDPLASWYVQLRYAPKIHAVNSNYFDGRLKNTVAFQLQQLYNTCLGQ